MIERLEVASGRAVSRETFGKLETYVDLLVAENGRQNLISKATEAELWERHIVDGAQLARFAAPGESWCDIGTGPGLPGIVIAILTGDPIMLVEPRRRRVEFLEQAIAALALTNASTSLGKVERANGQYDVITARAVAPLDQLFDIAGHLAHRDTKWVLPKGEKAKSELEAAQSSWQGRFQLVPSLTSAQASIVLAEGVQPKGKR